MRLCDSDIESWLDKGELKITPRPPKTRINGVTVDVLLGHQFRVFLGHTSSCIDLMASGRRDVLNNPSEQIMSDEIYVKEGEAFFLQPKELVLAVTYESITLPDTLVGWLDGRSSLARLGLTVHATAHRIDPGWHGQVVLECYNFGKVPLILRPSMAIAAISFEMLSGPAARPYHSRTDAKYKGQKGVVISRIHKD